MENQYMDVDVRSARTLLDESKEASRSMVLKLFDTLIDRMIAANMAHAEPEYILAYYRLQVFFGIIEGLRKSAYQGTSPIELNTTQNWHI